MPAEVRVLGPLEVVDDAGVVALPAKHARLLACLVVADGRALSVDELVEALWDGTAPASARKLIQVYVSQLRKALPTGCAISTRGSAYAIELHSGALDAGRFERLVDAAREAGRAGNAALALSLAERALALWRGRAYGEVAYEDFARAESERLEELRLVALEEQLSALLALGRHDTALGEILALAHEQPFRERPQELAMLALYRSGRQADALEHYSSVRTRLVEELGLEPGPALRDLQRRVLEQDASLGDLSTHASAVALPASPNALVGRDRELAELRTLLERRESRLLVLTGAGGSGKTRLALEVARAVASSYANGVALVELAPLRDPSLVVPTIAHALEISMEGDRDVFDSVVEILSSRELLLVVDNAEHVREAATSFASLVARAPGLTILVTSRAVLHVSGEHVIPVPPLAQDDAVELFVQRARLLDPSFERTAENEADVHDICRRVDCLPLAVELAAARVRTLTPRMLSQRLDERLRVLTGGPRDLPARQQTLRETIAWSVELLDGAARDVLARLAVFPAGATLEAAEEVCGADLDTLSALVDDHLVRRGDAGGDARFDMLETVREYALELLSRDRPAAELAMASYLVELTDRVEMRERLSLETLSELDPEVANVRAALSAAAEHGATEVRLQLAGNMWRYHWARGSAAEGIDAIEKALAASDGSATRARARALQGGAGLAWSLGDLEQAKRLATEAVEVAARTGSTWEESSAHTVLGVTANDEGDHESARHHHLRGLELAVEQGVEPVVQKLNLGIVALDMGEFDEAQELFEDVLAAHRRAERPGGIGFALVNLGLVRYELGDYEGSRSAFEEARGCFEQVGMRQQVAYTLQGLAANEAHHGCYEDAARLLGQARRELEEIGAPEEKFAPRMIQEVKRHAQAGLGKEAFEALYVGDRP